MCTNITLKSSDNTVLMARTMDFSFALDPEMMVYPRNFKLNFAFNEPLEHHYAFLGLSKNIGVFALADGINEHGLTAAALYFEGYATYESTVVEGKSIAPNDIVMWMLAKCKTVEDVKEVFQTHHLVELKLEFLGMIPPLHWVFQDIEGNSIIVEPLEDGIKIYENKLGVLTNSPDYGWHKTNVRSYIGLDPAQVEPRTIYGENFKAFGQGSGTFGLPGDLTPPSRFVKALYSKLSTKKAANEAELVVAASHILNNVDIPKGSVVTQRKTIDYTQYTAYMISNTQTYYYRLYDSLNTEVVNLNDFDLDGNEIIKV
ncbi:choloylglycine hydrolase family protein [Erysipelothrix inopinata]|uniref:Choloylglycine hydrolase family protein n=1 Tax=Erysipelothrix inopinata TaxID=225084 RepID=A0A7G9RY31_9FIRM|nr:choloylglycine hydrolase family protein [Erysipelothrix inopinata]QNN60506.1 choloylglycine hydrolase family protein [Erysipelothrix inopinata]